MGKAASAAIFGDEDQVFEALLDALLEVLGTEREREKNRHDTGADCACGTCRCCRLAVGELQHRVWAVRAWGTPDDQKRRRVEWLKSADVAQKLKLKAEEIARVLREFNCLLSQGETRDELEKAVYTRLALHRVRDVTPDGAILEALTVFDEAADIAGDIAKLVDLSDSVKAWSNDTKNSMGVERHRGRPRNLAVEGAFYQLARVSHELTGGPPAGLGTDRDSKEPSGALWLLIQRFWKICWPAAFDGDSPSESIARGQALRFVNDHKAAGGCPACLQH